MLEIPLRPSEDVTREMRALCLSTFCLLYCSFVSLAKYLCVTHRHTHTHEHRQKVATRKFTSGLRTFTNSLPFRLTIQV